MITLIQNLTITCTLGGIMAEKQKGYPKLILCYPPFLLAGYNQQLKQS